MGGSRLVLEQAPWTRPPCRRVCGPRVAVGPAARSPDPRPAPRGRPQSLLSNWRTIRRRKGTNALPRENTGRLRTLPICVEPGGVWDPPSGCSTSQRRRTNALSSERSRRGDLWLTRGNKRCGAQTSIIPLLHTLKKPWQQHTPSLIQNGKPTRFPIRWQSSEDPMKFQFSLFSILVWATTPIIVTISSIEVKSNAVGI